MFIQRLEEYKIPEKVDREISALLKEAFSGYPQGQSYYKQLPDFRYLIWEKNRLIGHMAVEHRLMSIDSRPIKVFGVVDLCIAGSHQRKKLATRLLEELEDLGLKCRIDFIILLARDHPFYLTNGFQAVDNRCKWVLIQDHTCLGVLHREIKQTLMVKPLSDKVWENGLVDFLGHIF